MALLQAMIWKTDQRLGNEVAIAYPDIFSKFQIHPCCLCKTVAMRLCPSLWFCLGALCCKPCQQRLVSTVCGPLQEPDAGKYTSIEHVTCEVT